MGQPLVSIVIPCYNCSQFIADTITSIQNQTHTNWEIIAINDGSKDNTLNTLQEIAEQEPKMQVYTHENKGVSATRNRGLDLAKGKYIVFLDSDDCLRTQFLEECCKMIIKDNSDFCTAEFQYINEDNSPIKMELSIIGLHKDLPKHLSEFSPGFSSCPSGYLYKLDAIKLNNIRFSEKLSSPADRHFLMNIEKHGLRGSISLSKESQLLYRVVKSSMSHNFNEKLVLEQETFLQEVLKDQLLEEPYKSVFIKNLKKQLFRDFIKLGKFGKALKYLF